MEQTKICHGWHGYQAEHGVPQKIDCMMVEQLICVFLFFSHFSFFEQY